MRPPVKPARAVAIASAEVRRCYEAALASDETLRGKLTVTFAILPGGGVSDAR